MTSTLPPGCLKASSISIALSPRLLVEQVEIELFEPPPALVPPELLHCNAPRGTLSARPARRVVHHREDGVGERLAVARAGHADVRVRVEKVLHVAIAASDDGSARRKVVA